MQGPDAGEFLNRLYCNGFAPVPRWVGHGHFLLRALKATDAAELARACGCTSNSFKTTFRSFSTFALGGRQIAKFCVAITAASFAVSTTAAR
nr:hypothetical protein [Nordella sp. HKS 07]